MSATTTGLGSSVDVRFLMAGERFALDGVVHRVDDETIVHEGVAYIPCAADGFATCVEVPADSMVELVDEISQQVLLEYEEHAA
jgi:hypothetical protein